MPATPADPPRRPTRRDQRRIQRAEQRRAWTALDTPHGFERCVRSTLRELYGYVALLTGRDRREAERIVGTVYRSLFRAVGAGQADSVTLGALRSAARRTWLDAHRVELATTDEVSRAFASTISELSALERAVLVLRHVNGMSTDRAATELGRSEREVAAVGAHAVRRLRGTDDTSGAWLRAYLGPTVTPAAGLVDRIVHQLGDPPPGADAHDAAADVAPTHAAPADAAGPDDEADHDEADDAMGSTTELAVVERATVEVPAVMPTAPECDAQTATGVERSSPDHLTPDHLTPGPSGRGHGDGHGEEGRSRWAKAIGVVLLAALVVALVWLALRGDPGDTVESVPGTSEPTAPTVIRADADTDSDDPVP
jgi:DNA-directed RNA polymerase specialized sigma24 family protein